jgi:uncharacterized SAM-binding protein YcdF (DUF218 family)
VTSPSRLGGTLRGAALLGAAWFLAVAIGARDIVSAGDFLPLLFALALGAALGWAGRERLAFGIMGALLVVVLVVGFTPVIPLIGRQLVRDDGPQHVDAVAILGAGATADGLVSPEGVARMLSAFERVGPADSTPMTVSVIRKRLSDSVTTTRDLQELIALVGGRRVTFLRDVFSTRDEALAVQTFATARGWRRIAVVTSPSHSARACRTFERVGLSITCWPSQERRARIAAASTVTERLFAAEAVFYELAGWMLYKARGWV